MPFTREKRRQWEKTNLNRRRRHRQRAVEYYYEQKRAKGGSRVGPEMPGSDLGRFPFRDPPSPGA